MYVLRGVKIMDVEKVGQLGHCPFEQVKGEINHTYFSSGMITLAAIFCMHSCT